MPSCSRDLTPGQHTVHLQEAQSVSQGETTTNEVHPLMPGFRNCLSCRLWCLIDCTLRETRSADDTPSTPFFFAGVKIIRTDRGLSSEQWNDLRRELSSGLKQIISSVFKKEDCTVRVSIKVYEGDVKEPCAFKDLIDKPDCEIKIKSRDTQDMITEGTGTPSPPNPPISPHPLP
ncbi:hypothetical protein DPX16_6234 [Anabarilius grahami]|uniref:Uncharacterized protein n=1 Tax=Anabarilius grahami TaxID=495550 RepID=A0A3N0XD12_ANAGA|nr:hypothetical protein DPX16_6234 [Anabarilius grahami]